MDMWWSQEQAGLIGGAILGGGIGTLSGLFGALIGFLVPRGIGKAIMVPAQIALVGFGLLLVGLAVIGVITGQPKHVWFPLVLAGGILTVCMGSLLPVTMNGYRVAERRKMDAQQLRSL